MSQMRGGEGQIVVRKTSKRSKLILGAAVASALAGMSANAVRATNYTWVGTSPAPSFWDTATNWSPNSAFPIAGDNAAFGNGATDFGVNLNGVAQNANAVTFSNTANSYLLSNGQLSVVNIGQTGSATNTISAALNVLGASSVSAGTLSLTNLGATANNFNGNTVNVNSGATLSAAGGFGGYTSAVNSATLNLNGGTFKANGISTGQNALLADYYPGAIDQGNATQKFARLAPDLHNGNGLLTLTPAGSNILSQAINFSDQGQGGFPGPATDIRTASGGLIVSHDDFAVAWSGNMHVSAADAGVWNFVTRSDDGSVIWIDLDHNGVFDFNGGDPGTTELIVNNNFDQGPTVNTDQGNPGAGRPASHPNPNFLAGDYKIFIGWYEGRVTGEVQAGFISPTHPGNPADPTTYTAFNPGDVGQNGLWSFNNAANLKYATDYSSTNVTVAASSSSAIDLSDSLGATFSNVTLDTSSTLSINGPATASNWTLGSGSTVTNTGSVRATGTMSLGTGATLSSGGSVSGNNLSMANNSTLNVTGASGTSTFISSSMTGSVTINTNQMLVPGATSGAITKLTKKGSGTLAMNDLGGTTAFAAGSTLSIQAGAVLSRSDGGSNNTTNAALISLEGGTFSVQAPSGVSGFRAFYYNGPNSVPLIDPISNLMALTPSSTSLVTGNVAVADRGGVNVNGVLADDIRVVGGIPDGGDGAQNYSVLWTAQLSIKPGQDGRYIFASNSDDGSTVWIDLNHNGLFEYSSTPALNELIVNNNVYQGPTYRDNNDGTVFNGHNGHPNLDLAAGDYQIAMATYEGGGGAVAGFTVRGPATNNLEQPINGSTPAQNGLWRVVDASSPSDANYSASDVLVTADSGIDVWATTATFKDLTVNAGKTLTITGLGTAIFATSKGSGGNLLLNVGLSDTPGAGMATGQILDGGGLTGITKSGPGTLILDHTANPSGLGAGDNVNITGGGLVVTGDIAPGNNPLGSASVTLGNGTSMVLSSKTFPVVAYGNAVSASGTVRISGGQRGSNAVSSGSVSLNTLNLADGTTLNTGTTDSYNLTFTQTNAAGNATINNTGNSNVVPVSFQHITGAGSSVLTFNGQNTAVFGNVAANNLVVNNVLTFDPVRGTSTSTVASNATINNKMIVASGVTDFGANAIVGVAPHFTAGLQEIFYQGQGDAFYTGPIDRTAGDNPYSISRSIQLYPRRANQARGTTSGEAPFTGTNASAPGWTDNSTYVYRGQILVPDNGTVGDNIGSIAFGESFDDSVLLKVDGVQYINNTQWQNATSSGRIDLTPGWHDIELRFGEGGGGVGPGNDQGTIWPATFTDGSFSSIGIQTDPTAGFDTATGFSGTASPGGAGIQATFGKYHSPVDNGAMNLFRYFITDSFGDIDVAAGAELRAGSVNFLNSINIGTSPTGSSNSTLRLIDHATASASSVDNLNIKTNAGSTATVNIGTNTTLTARALNLDADLDSSGALIKTGAGTLAISTTADIRNGTVDINGGRLEFNGTGPLSSTLVKANSGGTLGGSGHLPGDAQIFSGGHLGPHTSATSTSKLTVDGALTLDLGSQLNFNFGGAGDSVDAFTLTIGAAGGNDHDAVSTLNLHQITGFTVGTYRLFDFTNFGDFGDITIAPGGTATNDGPNTFNYSIVETDPTGTDRGHIDLIVTAVVLKWSGAFDNNWFIGGTLAQSNWKDAVSNSPDNYRNLVATVFDDSAVQNHNVNISEAAGVSPASILVDTTAGYSIGGNPIHGATGITKRGTGTLTLTGANDFIGPVIIENGTVDANTLPNGTTPSALGLPVLPISLGSAATAGVLRYSGASTTSDRGVTLNAGGGTINVGAANVGFSGVISGNGALTKIGAGTLTLSGTSNTNTGSLLINEGTLSVASMGVGTAGTTIGLGSGANAGIFEFTSAVNHTGGRGVTIPAAGGTVRVTNAATNLTLNGAVSGPTITKAGPGTLTLGGAVNFSGTSHALAANSGTLAFTNIGPANTISGDISVAAGSVLASTPGGLGTATVTINGGTFRTTGGGLTASFYNAPANALNLNTLFDLRNFASLNTPIATVNTTLADRDSINGARRGAMNFDAGNNNPFTQYGPTQPATPADSFPGVNNDNILGRYVGKIFIDPAYVGQPIRFVTASDDGSALWIDGDPLTDGSTTGDPGSGHTVNNNFFQGVTARGGAVTFSAGGWHDIEVGFYEGGGGAGMIVSWGLPNGPMHVIPNNVLAPVAPAVDNFAANNVNVAAASSSTIENFGPGRIGVLTLGAGSTTNVTGSMTATRTVLDPAGGTFTINTNQGNLRTAGSLTAPAVDGVYLGTLSSTAASTINKTGGGIVTIESDVTANRLAAGSIININAGNLSATASSAQANPFGAATVNIANGGGLLLGSRGGDYTFDTQINTTGTNPTVRLQVRPFGTAVNGGPVLPGNFNPNDPPDGFITMTVGTAAKPLNLVAGTTVQMTRSDANRIRLAEVLINGNATLNDQNTSFGVTTVNVNTTAPTAVLNFTGGGNRQRIAGTINAGSVVINNSNAVTQGVQTGGGVFAEPEAGTVTINAPVTVLSQLDANFGTLTISGGNMIKGQKMVATAGLRERFLDGANNRTFPAPAALQIGGVTVVPDSIQLAPRRANQARGNTDGNFNATTGWRDNTTYQYLGQFFVPDNGTQGDNIGSVAWGESFDDSVTVRIDGTDRINNTQWHNSTSTGQLDLAVGWHDIDLRFGEGGGGVGPGNGIAGWPETFPAGTLSPGKYTAIVYQTDPTLGFDANTGTDVTDNFAGGTLAHYFAPEDNGSMNLFRVISTNAAGILNVAPGAIVNAGGLEDMQQVNLSGAIPNFTPGAGTATLNLSATSSHADVSDRLTAQGSSGQVNTLNLSANNTLTVDIMTVNDGTTFNKNGAGTLRVTEVVNPLTAQGINFHNFGNGSEIHINGGKLIINTVGGAGIGNVFVHANATLGGKGSITGQVFVDPTGHVAPGASVGNLTVGALILDTANLDIEGNAADPLVIDRITLSLPDTLSLSGVTQVNLSDLGGTYPATPTDYILIDYAGTALDDTLVTNSFHVNGTLGGGSAQVLNKADTQDIILRLTPATPSVEWNVDSDGSWGVASNWIPQVVPDGADKIANFLGKITAARTVTLDGNRQVHNLNFDNTNTYTIAPGTGGTLTVGDGTSGGIDVLQGSHVISAGLALSGTVSKTGPGTLTISGAQAHLAGSILNVKRGVVNLNSNAGGGSAATSNLALTVSGLGDGTSARVNIGSAQSLRALTVTTTDTGSQTVDLNSPVLADPSSFNPVTIFAADLVAAKAALWNAITNANVPGAVDPLDGIIDSHLHANSGIGMAVAASNDRIVIRSTRIGDLNLDGTTTIADFIALASHFNQPGTWQEGDVNYDHNVTIADFIALASNFNQSYSGSASPTSSDDMQLLANFAISNGVDPAIIGSGAVPEPGTLGLLAFGALGLMGRRRRKA